MKKYILIIILAFSVCGKLMAQSPAPYNVVFDVTTPDTLVHQMVIHWIKEIEDVAPNANIEVVFYAKSLGMITNGKSTVGDQVMKYAANPNIKFRACAVAMKNNGVQKDQLLNGVGTVPDGIYEIIQKQHDGWGYIKAAR